MRRASSTTLSISSKRAQEDRSSSAVQNAGSLAQPGNQIKWGSLAPSAVQCHNQCVTGTFNLSELSRITRIAFAQSFLRKSKPPVAWIVSPNARLANKQGGVYWVQPSQIQVTRISQTEPWTSAWKIIGALCPICSWHSGQSNAAQYKYKTKIYIQYTLNCTVYKPSSHLASKGTKEARFSKVGESPWFACAQP